MGTIDIILLMCKVLHPHPHLAKNPKWPTKMATNEHFQSSFSNGNNQNFFLDIFRIQNMYVKKMCSSGVGEVSSLLYYYAY